MAKTQKAPSTVTVETNGNAGHAVFIPKRVALSNEEKAPDAAFIRIAGSRAYKAASLIRAIGKMAHKAQYSYTDKQTAKIFRILRSRLDAAEARYANAPETLGKSGVRMVHGNLFEGE
jgi:hypothetical protein